ncbi:non-hydrolyzing UDP-N-acetylglucosamine 2-epimerase [Sphingomonas jaspsi]|uniref:non-hydrolyzing UDP-N-acetylglucosamine 2-epimerase n=1 Tax=Sphingomonas jaspsi TaxID=392409 RepID=UPI0004B24F3B|nr:UDP-N-acetylglucosamine 2-epimerase (non-hydrolyzing) [Sphingomonas jaspsi]
MAHASIALVIGTRPEAIKLSPVARALAAQGLKPLLIVTGQHPGLELAGHDLDGFDSVPLCCEGLPDPTIHADLVRSAMTRVLALRGIDMVIVQGDTSSALGGALAAREQGLFLAHVEAGLRSHDPRFPWPEEENRVQIDRLADLLFAPTAGNAANLRREGVAGEVHVTGNTGIDALATLVGPLPLKKRFRLLPKRKFQLLVTCHRRENWGDGLARLADALNDLAGDRGVTIDVVLHPNPTVAQAMAELVRGQEAIRVLPPLSHDALVTAMRRADLLISDSGGMQEEAPALGVPMLVLRRRTERPEALASGNARMLEPDPKSIAATVRALRRDHRELEAMARPTMPFGDGRSAPRIAGLTRAWLDRHSAREPVAGVA